MKIKSKKFFRGCVFLVSVFVLDISIVFAECECIGETVWTGICKVYPVGEWYGDFRQNLNGYEIGNYDLDCGICGQVVGTVSRDCTPSPDYWIDSQAPTCTSKIFPDTWVNREVFALVDTCIDEGSVISRCDWRTSEKVEVLNYGESGKARISDLSGRTATCSASKEIAKIDRLPPVWKKGVLIRNSGFYDETSEFQPLSNQEENEVLLVADTSIEIKFSIEDASAGFDGIGQSGKSGIDWEHSTLYIAGPITTGSGKIAGQLGELALDDDIMITTDNSTPETITTITIRIEKEDFFQVAGHYIIHADVRDLAGNWADSQHGLLVHVVPGNVDPERVTLAMPEDCTTLVADEDGPCLFTMSMQDSFGNIIGVEAEDGQLNKFNYCGDNNNTGVGEECDDGNDVNDDGCSNICLLPVLGDGIVQVGEECDDGNRVDGDGCSKDGTIENYTYSNCNSMYFDPVMCFDLEL